jgi:hypothetical protein
MKKLIALGVALAPLSAFAQSNITNIDNIATRFTSIGNMVVTILISLSVIWIIWHVVRYLIIGGSDPENSKKAGMSILWGVVGLFVILSVWGLVNILRNSFTTDTNKTVTSTEIENLNPKIPTIK